MHFRSKHGENQEQYQNRFDQLLVLLAQLLSSEFEHSEVLT
jgi:hypothetical protein